MRKDNRIGHWVIMSAVLLLIPEISYAARKTPPEPEMFGGGQWFWALFSLVIVAFLAYWTTRLVAGKYGHLPSRHIKVAESLCLGANRHLYLLLVNKQVLLVGSSEHGVDLIKEYSDPAFYEEMLETITRQQIVPTDKFKELLAPLLTNIMAEHPSEEASEDRTAQLKSRLADSLAKVRAWRNKNRG